MIFFALIAAIFNEIAIITVHQFYVIQFCHAARSTTHVVGRRLVCAHRKKSIIEEVVARSREAIILRQHHFFPQERMPAGSAERRSFSTEGSTQLTQDIVFGEVNFFT